MTFSHFTEIRDCLAATDGGSLLILLEGPGASASFMLVHSLKAHGTRLEGRVRRGERGRLLSLADTRRLCQRLRELEPTMQPRNGRVVQFIQEAEKRAKQLAEEAKDSWLGRLRRALGLGAE